MRLCSLFVALTHDVQLGAAVALIHDLIADGGVAAAECDLHAQVAAQATHRPMFLAVNEMGVGRKENGVIHDLHAASISASVSPSAMRSALFIDLTSFEKSFIATTSNRSSFNTPAIRASSLSASCLTMKQLYTEMGTSATTKCVTFWVGKLLHGLQICTAPRHLGQTRFDTYTSPVLTIWSSTSAKRAAWIRSKYEPSVTTPQPVHR
jgi:hypothetical protein